MKGVCVLSRFDLGDFLERRKLRQLTTPTRAQRDQMRELDRRLACSMHRHISPSEACDMACDHSHADAKPARHKGYCTKPSALGDYPRPVFQWLTPRCIAPFSGARPGRPRRGIPGESGLVRSGGETLAGFLVASPRQEGQKDNEEHRPAPGLRSVFIPAKKRKCAASPPAAAAVAQ